MLTAISNRTNVFYKIILENIFTETELWLSHFISNAQETADLNVPRQP